MRGSTKITRLAVPLVVAAAAAVAALTAVSATAIGQDTDPSNTAVTRPDDYIYARQLLMEINETDMPPIDKVGMGGDGDLATVKALAFEISNVLSIAPHMFNSATKPVKDTDGSPLNSTNATLAVWDDFDAFYDRMTAASDLAYKASQVTSIDEFRPLAMQLRADCDGCHDKYMHVYDPSAGQ